MRQSLHIRIDPSPYDPEVIISPDSTSPSPSSAHLSAGTARTTPTSSSSDQEEFSVLCVYDFQAADPDQLSFRKNEILSIVKQESTGWWAAMRRGGDVIGWIPKAFVTPLSGEMAKRLSNVREELRFYEYSAEQLYSAPVLRTTCVFDSEPEPSPAPKHAKVSSQVMKPPQRRVYSQHHAPSYRARINPYSDVLDAHTSRSQKHAPPSPTTPMPQPSNWLNKPTPPTPNEKDDIIPQDLSRFMRNPSVRRKFRTGAIDIRGHSSPEPVGTIDISFKRTVARTRGPVLAEDNLQPILILQASVPRYLRPRFANQLDEDADGQVRNGTVPALVERLMATNIDNKQYQNIFLMTFRSFMTADVLFDALVGYYNLPQPDDLTASELEDWLERGKGRTQRRVLELFSDWLQSNHLLEEEPHIAGRLTEFLQSITTTSNAKVAKLIQERIKDLTFSIGSPVTVSPSSASRRKRGSRPQKGELLRIGSSDIAEQLSVILHETYRKILPHECVLYVKSQNSPMVGNLREFCASHEKVISWVRTSILTVETMKKRAETIDYWIKVAEKCRALNNIASMSAIVTALSGIVITKLPLTMAHVNRKSTLESLLRYNDPAGNFATYRNLNNVDGPCLPFITMYLTDMNHIQDQYSDKGPQICLYKRKRFYDIISTMLRHQKDPYALPLYDDVAVFIRNHLQDPPDNRWFWKKSEEVQQSELAHADIRKGLEKAGF